MKKDRNWLYFAVLARSLATGMIGVLLGIYLSELALKPGLISLTVGIGLVGAVCASLVVTLLSDRIGHRRALFSIALLSGFGALSLAFSTHPLTLAFAAFVGMVNGMGRDRGAALIVEQAALPATVGDRDRTMTFAKYNVLQDIGHAVGSLLAAAPSFLQHTGVASGIQAFRGSILIYAALSLLPVIAYLQLSPAIEVPHVTRATRLSDASRKVMWKISSLFALDSLGGGFLTTTLLSFFFHERFGVGIETVGALFFVARIANAASHL